MKSEKNSMITFVRYLLIFIIFFTNGCIPTYYYYLQDSQVYTSFPDDTKIIYKDRNARDLSVALNCDYSGKATFSGNNGMHSAISDNGSVVIDTIYDTTWGEMGYTINERYSIVGSKFKGNNEFISCPEISAGLEIEFNLSKYIFLATSLHYARNNNYNNFRYSFGVGGGYYDENIGICGVIRTGFQSYYCATEILHGERNSGFYTTGISEYNLGFYVGTSIGINSIKEFLFLNYYLNLSMNIFEYIDVSFGEDFNYDAIFESFIISPGILKDIGNNRISAGFSALFVTTLFNRHLEGDPEHFFPKVFLQYTYRFKIK